VTLTMRLLVLSSSLLSLASPHPQISFGGSGSSSPSSSSNNKNINIADITGRLAGSSGNYNPGTPQCCCVDQASSCFSGLDHGNSVGEDLVGLGLIDERIVNRPGSGHSSSGSSYQCPRGQRQCCYTDARFSCPNSAGSGSSFEFGGGSGGSSSGNLIKQRCQESSSFGSNQCGQRSYQGPVSGLSHGESSPGEFPWTCLILNQNNDFVGSCAIIPETSSNSLSSGTSKVITAAHNLKNVGGGLKVRVGEYDASAFKRPELVQHEEYSVTRVIKHPSFDNKRLTNDIAVLRLSQRVNLAHPYVSAACLPACEDQFSFTFSNGTGARCHVAGWGKDEFSGNFQFIQHKVDIPLMDDFKCNAALKLALNRRQRGVGDRFQLHSSEICAGGEVGKDACTGDGGSPLVCQSDTGRWTVVGLVTWGVGCGSDTPGVYANVGYFRNWINSN